MASRLERSVETSGTAVGAVAITWGVLALASVAVRVKLAHSRRLGLRSHDWYIIAAVIGVLALCVWAALAGLSNVLNTGDLSFIIDGRNGNVSAGGIAAFTIIRVYCSVALFSSVELFYMRLYGWDKKGLIRQLLCGIVGFLYGLVLGVSIAQLVRDLPLVLAGFIIGGAAVDLVVTIGLLAVPLVFRSRLGGNKFPKGGLAIFGILSLFVFAAAIAQLAFTIDFSQTIFRSTRYNGYDPIRSQTEYNQATNLTLWGVLFIATWTIVACLPSFSFNIQTLSNRKAVTSGSAKNERGWLWNSGR